MEVIKKLFLMAINMKKKLMIWPKKILDKSVLYGKN
jgi:hypothetical protein